MVLASIGALVLALLGLACQPSGEVGQHAPEGEANIAQEPLRPEDNALLKTNPIEAVLEGERYQASVPDTLDLVARMDLAINALVNAFVPSERWALAFNVDFSQRPPLLFVNHSTDAWLNIPAKFIEALVNCRLASGSNRDLEADRKIIATQLGLIGGDVRSCWASRGQNRPDFEEVWIRIDLPTEALVDRVVLVGHPEGMGRSGRTKRHDRVGQSFPRRLEVRLARDSWHWTTAYKTDDYAPQNIGGRNEVSFNRRQAKQIWVLASDPPITHYFGHSFSIAELEVLDEEGKNVALASRGAGVQVSSTHSGYGMDRFTQDMLWPTQYDLGFKWTRVGYDMSLFQWAYVEREKGKLQVDERADAVVTEAVKNGIEVVMCLDKGNWHYAPEPRTPDRTKDLMETYANNPGGTRDWQRVPLDHPAQLEGFLNYVRFMVRHF